jgi:muramoyltetrapeptide carboxypeptidase LdcA involved in peptidoglycan recycling
VVKPRRLRRGDRIRTVSLSWGGPATFPHRYEAGKRQLEAEFEVSVEESRHALADAHWLAKNPQARADDLMEAFADPSVQAIVSTIGGDDSLRLIPLVDLRVIRDHPKVFMGYSDTTVAHMLCHQAGLTSFYGPSVMSGFGENAGIPPYVADSVRRTVFESTPAGRITHSPAGWTDDFLDWADPSNQEKKRRLEPPMPWRIVQGAGKVRGRLIGGCMEVWQWLRGTPVWPTIDAFDGALLFIETSEEGPTPRWVARELRTYARMGILQRIAAILFGRPGGRLPPARFVEYDEWILKVVREEGLTDLPIVTRMDFGHTEPMFVIPYGVTAELDCEAGALDIVEPAVVDLD